VVARELTGRWTAGVLLAANVAFALYALVEQLGYAGVLFVCVSIVCMLLFAAILALSHLVSFGVNFLWRREFRGGSLWKLVAQPVLPILGIVAVIGVSLMIAFAQPWVSRTQIFAVLIIAAKIAVDVRAHLNERRRFEESTDGRG
jgi:hypothetical protein